MLKLHKNFVLLATIAGLVSVPAHAAGHMSTSEMVLVLREAKVVSPATRLDVLKSDQDVTVITKRTPKMNDDDCKIKAVLMAKALMDAQPKQLAAVKVIYTVDGENGVSRVVVGAGDVHAFAGGTITEKQLLASLDLQKEAGDGSDNGKEAVVAGPQKEKRAVLQSRIEALKQGGTGVAPFQKMFNDIEDLTRAGKTKEASQLIGDLSAKLSSQESLRDQAKRVGEGRGVKGQQGTASADLGKNQFRPGRLLPNGAPPAGSPLALLQQRAQEIRSHFAEMENRGIATGDFRARLKDVEGQFSKLPAQEAIQRIDDIKSRMMQSCGQSTASPGGQWKGK